jgi:hypothetical protein
MLDVIAPYGGEVETVVDPARFQSWLAAPHTDVEAQAGAVRDGTRQVVERQDEQPNGPGFYAFGAVVLTLYAADVLLGEDDEAIVNVAKRFLDLLGAADDDGESGMYGLAVRFFDEPEAVSRTLRRRVRRHVTRS